MIVLRGIRFESHCEHHMAPIIGRAWVAYIPMAASSAFEARPRRRSLRQAAADPGEDDRADRQHDQDVLKPQGVAVMIKAEHHCMTTRGVHKPGTDMVTSRMLGAFRDNPITRRSFWRS